MKRQRGEACALTNDCNLLRYNFQTKRSQPLECCQFERSCDDSFFRRQQEHRPRQVRERNTISNRSEVDLVLMAKGRKAKGKYNLALGRRMISATFIVLVVFLIHVANASEKSQTEEKDPSAGQSLQIRNLQGDIQKCKIALAVGDIDRDNLLGRNEYLRFVKHLSSKILDDQNSGYESASMFAELPQNLKKNFNYFSDPGPDQIDVSGSKPGQAATPEQDTQLTEFCDLTIKNIRDPNSEVNNTNDPVEPGDPNPADNDVPNIAKSCSETVVDRGKCNVDLSISDTDRNDLFDESNYVKFVNRRSSNKYANTQFGQLPRNIKNNFYRFAIKDGQVDVTGSKPGQRVSVEQDIFLNAFCCETSLAVQNPGSAEEPSQQPDGPAPTGAPTIDLFFCQRSMASSDLDRDNELTKAEYVIFLNRLTNNQFVGQTYDALNADLQANFVKLIGDNGKIDIYGSKPGQTTGFEEENALVNVCEMTGNALKDVTPSPAATPPTPIQPPTPVPTTITTPTTPSPIQIPSAGPTISPTTSPAIASARPEPSTFEPGKSEVYNSFIISNRIGLVAANLTSGALSLNRKGLDDAYGVFVKNSVENFPEPVEIRKLRHRRLTVQFLSESDQIYRLVDSDCPEGLSPIETCQIAFAKFLLSVEGEKSQDISTLYSNYTQNEISNGKFQFILKEVDPRTILNIVDVSYPVAPPAEAFTNAPTSSPMEKKEKRPVLAIVGGVFCAIFVLAIIGYVATKGLPFDLPNFPNRGGARVGNKAIDDDDDEIGLDIGQDDDDNSVGDKNAFKEFGHSLDDDEVDDEEPKEKSGIFGFSSKNKKNEEIEFGLDSKNTINANSADVSDNMYAFEEPSEIDSETDNQEDLISAVDNEDIVFGEKPESSNWDTNNVFDSGPSNEGWGANGGEENFFETSAFREGQEDKEISPSGSEETDSYSSEDETYESGEMDGTDNPSEQDSATYDVEEIEQEDSFTASSADESYNSASLPSEKMTSDLKLKNEDMNTAIDNGDWDAVVKAAKAFDKDDQESSMAASSKRMALSDDDDEEESYSSYSESGDESATTQTTTSSERRKRLEYRAQVDELVQIVLPEETEKVDAMMDQFKGREAELVSTLQTMEERSSNQRARAAIHKSKPPSQQQIAAYSMGGANGGGMQGGEGSTAGTAAIAAASLPIPAEGVFDDESQDDNFEGDFGDRNAFGDEGEDQYDDQEGSYYSEEGSQVSGSFYSEEESVTRSYYSEEGSQPKSFYSQQGGSHLEETYYSEEEGSQQEGSFYSQEGESIAESYYSEEGSQSYVSGQERSFISGEEGEGSFYSEEEESVHDKRQSANSL